MAIVSSEPKPSMTQGFQGRFLSRLIILQLLVIVCAGLFPLIVTPMIQAGEGNAMTWQTALIIFLTLGVPSGICITLIAVQVSGKFARPLRKLESAMEALQRGERPSVIDVAKGDELPELIRAFNATFESQLQQLTDAIDRKLDDAGIDQTSA